MHVPPAERLPSRAYANFVLGVLVAVYVVNYVDRQLISILIEPIKAEFGATDTDPSVEPVPAARDGARGRAAATQVTATRRLAISRGPRSH